jgi:hypothetical protein
MDYVINKRIIHLQKDGKQLCYWNGKYGHWPYRVATDEEVAKYHLCGNCRKASKKFDDAPVLSVKVPLTQDDMDGIIKALDTSLLGPHAGNASMLAALNKVARAAGVWK